MPTIIVGAGECHLVTNDGLEAMHWLVFYSIADMPISSGCAVSNESKLCKYRGDAPFLRYLGHVGVSLSWPAV